MKAVVAQGLSKQYPSGTMALDGADFSIEPGEIFGFLGPNGAGKTTTVKMLVGVLSPTEGMCEVFGLNPAVQTEKAHMISGVVTEHAQMYDTMTGLENLLFYGTMFGLDKRETKKRSLALLEQLSLSDAQGKKLGAYSTGMRQRLSLARALIHRPKILFLDEPTSGLDPQSTQDVNNLIKTMAIQDGVSVFLCTHQLRYAQEICTQYGLISQGKLLATGNIDQLRQKISPGVQVHIEADGYPPNFMGQVDGSGVYRGQVASEDEIPGLVRQIVAQNGAVYHVSAQKPSLEDIYFTLIGRAKGDAQP